MRFKETDSAEDSKNYIRLKDKESITGVFRGEPFDFRQHWVGARSEVCRETDCGLCSAGNKSTFRFKINIVIKEGDGYIAKIFEQGYALYKDLNDLQKNEYPLEFTIIKLTRSGSGKNDTKYSVLPIPNFKVTDQMEAKLSTVKLHDLNPIVSSATNLNEPPNDFAPPMDLSDAPF